MGKTFLISNVTTNRVVRSSQGFQVFPGKSRLFQIEEIDPSIVDSVLKGFATSAPTLPSDVINSARFRSPLDKDDLVERLIDVATPPIHDPVMDITALRAVVAGERIDKMLIFVEDEGTTFNWDAQSTGVDDGSLIIRPDDVIMANPGRWLKGAGGGVVPISVVQTTDATPKKLFGETIPAGKVFIFQVFVTARKTDGTKRAAFIRTIRVHREGAGVALGIPQADYTDKTGATGLDVVFAAVVNDFETQVIGLPTETFDWEGGVIKAPLS